MAMGFEPMNRGFAIRSLSPLGHATNQCRVSHVANATGRRARDTFRPTRAPLNLRSQAGGNPYYKECRPDLATRPLNPIPPAGPA